jgi:hypothetical protein
MIGNGNGKVGDYYINVLGQIAKRILTDRRMAFVNCDWAYGNDKFDEAKVLTKKSIAIV